MLAMKIPSSPQMICTAGPTTNWPGAAGKYRSSAATTRWALLARSAGNSTASSDPAASPDCKAVTFTVRFTPTRPPTPVSAKPKPSSIGGKVTDISTTSEYPAWPPGSLVVRRPTAERPMVSNWSSAAPAYRPAAGSANRYPPPVTTEVSIASPAPVVA